MNDTVTVSGRTYQVERYTRPGVRGPDTIQYRLTGQRGAVYHTMRNAKTPQALFVVVGAKTLWFTDINGCLEHVAGLGVVVKMAGASKPAAPVMPPELVQLQCEVARLQAASTRTMEARAALPAGSSRARVTSANARWMRAAEARDRAVAALEDARASSST